MPSCASGRRRAWSSGSRRTRTTRSRRSARSPIASASSSRPSPRCTTPARTSWPTGGWPRSPPHDPAAQDDVARALSAAAQQGPAAAADVAELTATSERYESDLSLLGLSDDDLARGLTPAGYKRRIGRSALTAALTAPLAAIGAVIHFVPYQIMKQVGKRPSEGMRATVKLARLHRAVHRGLRRHRDPRRSAARAAGRPRRLPPRPAQRLRHRPLGRADGPPGRPGPGSRRDGRAGRPPGRPGRPPRRGRRPDGGHHRAQASALIPAAR